MNKNLLIIIHLILSIAFVNAELTAADSSIRIFKGQQASSITLILDFPVEPDTMTDLLPIEGQALELNTIIANNEDGVFLLFELQLGELESQVNQDHTGFFHGLLSYLMNDLGVQFDGLTDYEYNGFKGINFNIISPDREGNRTTKGKTLLIGSKAYIWFAASNTQDSSESVKGFINSLKLKFE